MADRRMAYESLGGEEVRSMAELLPWLFPWGNAVVVGKDSGLLACYGIEGVDAEALMPEEVNGWAEQMQSGLNGLSAWPPTVWWTVHRRRHDAYPSEAFINPMARRLDQHLASRQRLGKNFTNQHYISVLADAMANRMALQERLRFFLQKHDSVPMALMETVKTQLFRNSSFAYMGEELEGAVKRFEEMLEGFSLGLRDVGFKRLTGDRLMAFLHACASPVHGQQERVAVPMSSHLDAWLGDAMIVPQGNHLQMAGFRKQWITVINIKEWPKRPNGTRPKMLESLLRLPVELTLSLCWRRLDKDQCIKLLKQREKVFELSQFGVMTYVGAMFQKDSDMKNSRPKADKQEGVKALQEQIRLVEAGKMAMGPANVTVLVHGNSEEEMEQGVGLVESALRHARLTPTRETLHTTSGFAGTLPGQWGESVRWVEMNSAHIADLAPIYSARSGDEINAYLSNQLNKTCPALAQFMTEVGTVLNFNFHVLDKGHTLVVGPTRGGKTVFINLLTILWLRYGKVRVIRFDRDRSCRIACLLTGGRWINTRDPNTRCNPLVLLKEKRHWPFLGQFIERLATSLGYEFEGDDARAVQRAMEMTNELPAVGYHRLKTLWSHLSSDQLKNALAPWVGKGTYGGVFDNEDDDFGIADNLCIELGGILVAPRAAELFVDLCLYRIEDMLNQMSEEEMVPTFIYIEEAGDLLRHPWFAAKADGMLKRLGKKLCHLVLTVQSPEDGVNNPHIKASLRDNLSTCIYLPNRRAATASLSDLYQREMNLNPKQVQQIATAINKRQYLIVQEGISRLITTDLDEFALSFLRSDVLAQQIFDRHWLEGKGVPGWEENYIQDVLASGVAEEVDEDE